jgi:transcriptional regulator with XRE-family HTH domain
MTGEGLGMTVKAKQKVGAIRSSGPLKKTLANVRPKRGDPMEQAEFRSRLRAALNGESVNGFAKRVPVSQSVMRQYLIGESEPTRPVVIAIAKAAHVSPAWLAFGIGSAPAISDQSGS